MGSPYIQCYGCRRPEYACDCDYSKPDPRDARITALEAELASWRGGDAVTRMEYDALEAELAEWKLVGESLDRLRPLVSDPATLGRLVPDAAVATIKRLEEKLAGYYSPPSKVEQDARIKELEELLTEVGEATRGTLEGRVIELEAELAEAKVLVLERCAYEDTIERLRAERTNLMEAFVRANQHITTLAAELAEEQSSADDLGTEVIRLRLEAELAKELEKNE